MRTPVTPNHFFPIGQSNKHRRTTDRRSAEDQPEDFPENNNAPSIRLNAIQEELTAQEVDEMLSAELDEGIAIDTKELGEKLRKELKSNSISLAKFSKSMYDWDSHTNLSDLLRKPKAWETLSGKVRFNYLLMYNWMNQPSEKKLRMFEIKTEQAKQGSKAAKKLASKAAKVQSVDVVNRSNTVSPTPSVTLSTQEVVNMLDAALEANTSIDTIKLAVKLRAELKEKSISLEKFSWIIFGWESHSNLSDLLRVPKPWEALDAKGRFNYLRMYNWMNQPLESRLMMFKVMAEQAPPVPTKSVPKRRKLTPEQEEPVPKQSRFFTEDQKMKLDATFKEIPRPSKACKRFIVENLELKKSTVDNYFKNSRARQQQVKIVNKRTK